MLQNLFKTKTRIAIFTAIVAVSFVSRMVFATPPVSFYTPGETLNPTCLPTDTNCDVEAPLTSTTGQAIDSDLTTIAGLTATTNNFIQSVGSAWASRTPTQATATLDAMVGDSGAGGTKGLVPAPAAGDAAASKFLKADGTWTAVSSGLTIGTSSITSGSSGNILYNNAGVLGEMTTTGSGTVVALATSPTFTTSLTSPLIIGSTSTTGDLTLQTTSGVGTTGADMHFLVGNNGATEAMTILNNGNVGIGTANPGYDFEVSGYFYASGYVSSPAIIVNGGPTFRANGNQFVGYHPTLSDISFALTPTANDSTGSGKTVLLSTNGASYLNGGNVGIGETTPTAVLHLKAGTATASTAPLKFTSGTLLTTAEAGAVEFLTDAFYGTITTGAARKTFAFLESPSFTTPTLGVATATSLALGGATIGSNALAVTGSVSVDSGAISYDTSTGVTSIDNLNLGTLGFDTDAGIVTWADMPVASATSGTVESYRAKIDGTNILAVYAESNGSGGVQNTGVTIDSNTATSTGVAVTASSLTSGSGIRVTGSGATMTTGGEAVDLVMGANTVGAGVTITSTGAYTGVGAADGLINITANSLTSGYAFQIPHTTSVISTTGSLMRLSSTSVDTGTTGTLLSLSSSGSVAGTIAMITNNTASFTGISQAISMTGQTTGTGLSITGGGANLAAGGELIDLQMGAATAGNGLNIVNTGAYVGTGLINVSHTTSAVGTNGSLVRISSTSNDTNTSQGILLDLSSTASTAGTQFLQTYSGLTTGIGQSIVTNALSSGTALNISSTSTAAASNTQKLLNIALSGANGTATQTTYGAYISNTHTGTTSTNVGLYATASGGTTNYAAQFVGSVDMDSGAFLYDTSTGVTAIDNLNLGTLGFDTDAGIVTWVDMPVTDAPADDTVESYTASLDGNAVLTIYGLADSAGAVDNIGVGIGTTTPTARFQIDGNASAASWTTTGIAFDVNAATFTDTSTAAAGTVAVRTANSFGAPTFASTNAITVTDAFTLYVPKAVAGTNTTITRANSAYFEGNVGIGTTTPTTLLELSADSATKPTTNTWTIASDVRIKNDVNNFTDGLETILKIRPVTYKYNGLGGLGYNDDGTHIGIIAQELELVAPYMVETRNGVIDGQQVADFKAYQGHALPFILVNAVKELNLKIDGYEARIAALENPQTLCVADSTGAKTCITKSQLDALLSNAGISSATTTDTTTTTDTSTTDTTTSDTTSTDTATTDTTTDTTSDTTTSDTTTSADTTTTDTTSDTTTSTTTDTSTTDTTTDTTNDTTTTDTTSDTTTSDTSTTSDTTTTTTDTSTTASDTTASDTPATTP